MKRVLILFLTLILAIVAYWYIKQLPLKKISSSNQKINNTSISPTKSLTKKYPTSTSLFIPYWNIASDEAVLPTIKDLSTTPNDLIYFAIKPGTNGIDQTDQGYKNLEDVNQLTSPSMDILTLRMLDSDQNLRIVEDVKKQQKIIDDTINIAQGNNFHEILLDFELSALPFQDLQDQITSFVKLFSDDLKSKNLKLSMTLYGDQFYRHRPFDIKAINPYVNSFYVMAYDLHKSDPGPNFPLNGNAKYGTDLTTMVSQFTQLIPSQKLNIIFGMYGYDWTVDANKRGITPPEAISLVDIKKKFLDGCTWQNCLVTRDQESEETEIDYVDDSTLPYATDHIVWFEDETSVEKKIEYLKTQGITNFSFWVWGYY